MQRDMLRTANELVKRGHSVEIFAMSWDGEQPKKIAVHVLPIKGFLNYQRYQKFINLAHAQIKQAANFDFVFGYNRMHGLDAHFAADPCFIERAHSQRSFLYRLLPRVKWFAECERVIFAKASNTKVLMVSEAEKTHFQHWYQTPNDRFYYIPPYLSAERFKLQDKTLMRQHLRNTFGFVENDFVFMLTGSGFHMKGLDRAILAIAALPKVYLSYVRLIAVGQDNPKPFQRMAKKLGIAQNLVITKGRPDIPQLMQGADVCIHPAYRENTGLVILEALACGAPMLVTDTCGYAQRVIDANAGVVVSSPFDQTVFNQTVLEIIDSPQKIVWAENGLKYANQLMTENDGSAEAKILIDLAERKNHLAAR